MRKEIELNIGLLVEKTGKEISRGVAAAALAATGFESHASILHNGEWEGKPQPTLVVVGFASIRGIGLRLGFPLSEFGRLGLRYTLRQDDIVITGPAGDVQEGITLLSQAGFTYVYDDKDDPIEPKNGLSLLRAHQTK